MSEATNLQINGPVVVLPLDEYLEIRTQLEEYRRIKAIYDKEQDTRFQRLFSIAERNQDIPAEEVEADVAAAIDALRSSE